MSLLRVLSVASGVSVQDGGRFGFQRYGVGPAGAMDGEAFFLANALVGNAPGTAALEFTLIGGKLKVEGGPARLALAGGGAQLFVDGQLQPPLTSVTLEAGQDLAIGPAREGVTMVLAVAGGLDLPPQLGSLSYHRRAGLGGMDGRAVMSGDLIALKADSISGPELTLDALPPTRSGPFRVVLGPQDDYITEAGIETFLREGYTISAEADRMGFRLTGPVIEHALGYNIVSDGIVTGSVQVPGSGEPIILLADRQTTGGYPKIATVISADLPRLSQQRPGTVLHFAAISRDDAIIEARRAADARQTLLSLLRPLTKGFDSERLLGLNLVGGFTAE